MGKALARLLPGFVLGLIVGIWVGASHRAAFVAPGDATQDEGVYEGRPTSY